MASNPALPKLQSYHSQVLASQPASQLQSQRGKMLVAMARKRKSQEQQSKSLSKVQRQETRVVSEKVPECRNPGCKELNRELMVVDEENEIGTGSFGRCYPGIYRDEFNVLVKVIKAKYSSFTERERAKREIIHEATVISRVGDHPRIPHLFGVCSEQSPFC